MRDTHDKYGVQLVLHAMFRLPGTIAAGLATAAAATRDPHVAALLQNPFALTPDLTGPPQPRDEQVMEVRACQL